MGYVLTPHPAGHIPDIGEIVESTSQVQTILPRSTRDPWRGQPPLGAPFRMNRDSWQSYGLVFWLPMLGYDAGAQRFIDRAGGLSMTPNGSPVWTPDGWLGNALLFDNGSTQYLEYSGAAHSSLPITMVSWFNSDDVTIAQNILWMASSSTSRYIGIGIHGQTGGDPAGAFINYADTEYDTMSTGGYSANTWYHLGGVFTSSTRAIWLDGNKDEDTGLTQSFPPSQDRTTIGVLHVESAKYWPMSGSIADARIYNRALSDAEVAQLYDPKTRWELYEPERRFWSGWSEPEVQVETNVAHNVRNLHGTWGVSPPVSGPYKINRDSQQSDGLVFWLPMLGYEAGAQRFVDKANGLVLTPYNSPTWTPDGWLGNALLFDDASDEFLYSASPPVTAPPFTLSVWFNSDSLSHISDLVTLRGSAATYDGFWLTAEASEPGDPVRFGMYGGSVYAADTISGYSANTWHLACGVAAATNDRAVFIDGGSKGTETTDASTSINYVAIGASYGWGAGGDPDDWGHTSGMLADARIYNRALSDDEVKQIYDPLTRWELYQPEKKFWTGWDAPEDSTEPRALVSRGSWDLSRPPLGIEIDINWDSPQAKGLVFWLPMLGNEAGANQFIDKVGGLALTPYNSPVWTPDGWLGNALEFTAASSQYLRVTDVPVTTWPMTLAAWFNPTDLAARYCLLAVNVDSYSFHYRRLEANGESAVDAVVARENAGSPVCTATASAQYSAGEWAHAVGSFVSISERHAYYNGSNKGSDTTTGSTPNTPTQVDIGVCSTGAYLNGCVADARIYNRALSDDEVRQLYDPKTRWDLYKFRVMMGRSDITELIEEELPGLSIPVLLAHLRQQRIAG